MSSVPLRNSDSSFIAHAQNINAYNFYIYDPDSTGRQLETAYESTGELTIDVTPRPLGLGPRPLRTTEHPATELLSCEQVSSIPCAAHRARLPFSSSCRLAAAPLRS